MLYFPEKQWKKLKDWQRVLLVWRHVFERFGLSLHALASICNRDPKKILGEFLRTPGTTITMCNDVSAPMLSYQARVYVDPCCDQSAYSAPTRRRVLPSLLFELNALLQEFPWPEYKTIWRGRGYKTFREGPENLRFPREELALLRRAAGGATPVYKAPWVVYDDYGALQLLTPRQIKDARKEVEGQAGGTIL